jgi:hypothetical protein
MDESQYGNQDGQQNSIIIMGIDEMRMRQPHRSDGLACGQLDNDLCRQYEASSIYETPVNIPASSFRGNRSGTMGYLLILLMALFTIPVSAVFIEFSNCLSEAVQNNSPLQLQFVPLFLDATFNTTDPSNGLHVTVWGNVTGSGTDQRYILPPPNNSYWITNQTNLGGKILDEPEPDSNAPKLTTLSNKVDVLTYEAWSQSFDFCDSLINASCPLGPRFFANAFVPRASSLFGQSTDLVAFV